MHILVVEDEQSIADFISRGLQAEGYAVSCAEDGPTGERLALVDSPDLVVLDLMLPGKDGLAVLEAIRRERAGLPVILLTARGEVEDRVAGLDRGATDYLTKPFSFAELAARIRAHLRTSAQSDSVSLDAGPLEVDLRTRKVLIHGDEVRLSAREFELLVYLMRHPNQVLSREQLLSGVWGYDHDPGTNVVEVYIGYLRRKLGTPDRPAPIETVRSVGYRLQVDGG